MQPFGLTPTAWHCFAQVLTRELDDARKDVLAAQERVQEAEEARKEAERQLAGHTAKMAQANSEINDLKRELGQVTTPPHARAGYPTPHRCRSPAAGPSCP